MLEIVFSDSAEGALKFAQGWGEGSYNPGGVGFAFEENEKLSKLKLWLLKRRYLRKEKKEWENTVVLSGNASDVFGLSLSLSMGDISADRFWEKREKVFLERTLFDLSPERAEEAKQSAHRRTEKLKDKLEQIYERASAGEALRIWVGTSAEERCMLAWFAAQLAKHGLTSAKVYLNELPTIYHRPEGDAVSLSTWGEVEPSRWGYLDRELRREVSSDFFTEQAEVWRRLQNENTELRIVENETIESVDADYYDALIKAEIDRQPEEFHEAHLIGTIVGTQIDMPDTWIASRIEQWIASGELMISWEEEPGSRSYRRKLKKSQQ